MDFIFVLALSLQPIAFWNTPTFWVVDAEMLTSRSSYDMMHDLKSPTMLPINLRRNVCEHNFVSNSKLRMSQQICLSITLFERRRWHRSIVRV